MHAWGPLCISRVVRQQFCHELWECFVYILGGTNSTYNQVHIYGSFVPLDANPEDLYSAIRLQ
jgi:hypothetical protein